MGNRVDRRRIDAVETDLREEKKRANDVKTILLLGSHSSGKSTIYKQLRHIYGNPLSQPEIRSYVPHIHDQCIGQMKSALDMLNDFQEETALSHSLLKQNYEQYAHDEKDDENGIHEIPRLSDQGVEFADYIQCVPYSNHRFTDKIVNALKELWKEPAIKKMYELRNMTTIADSTAYFWNKLDAINDPNWLPNTHDIMLVLKRTTGVAETQYEMNTQYLTKKSTFKIIDVGGTRSERRKWRLCFDSVTAVIFVASLSCYDEMLFEEHSMNKMTDQLLLFDDIVNNQSLLQTSIILFLNKMDLFAEKIKRVPLNKCESFVTYRGEPNSFDQTTRYIRKAFTSLNKTPQKRNIFTHITCATDTDNVQKVFADVQHIVIEASLIQAGLMDWDDADLDTTAAIPPTIQNQQSARRDVEHQTDEITESQPLRVSELLARINAIERRHSDERREWQAVMSSMQDEMERLKASNIMYREEHKEAQLKIVKLETELREIKFGRLDTTQFMQWDSNMVLKWIMSLDEGRFNKYENVLKQALQETDVAGEDLLDVNPLVIKIWGVRHLEDQRKLAGHIRALVQQNADPELARRASVVKEGAPTEYH